MRKFLAVLALLACGSAWADGGSIPKHGTEPGEVERIQVHGMGAIDYQRLFEEVSEPGEAMDAFVLRIAPQLAEYTAATGFEACGAIATDGERFGVIVGSNGGHTVCVNFHSRVPAGMVFTRQTVHSHTTMKSYRLTATDTLVVRGMPAGAVQRGGNAERFSDEDFAAPGYVVTSRTVKHQAGKGTERTIGRFR